MYRIAENMRRDNIVKITYPFEVDSITYYVRVELLRDHDGLLLSLFLEASETFRQACRIVPETALASTLHEFVLDYVRGRIAD